MAVAAGALLRVSHRVTDLASTAAFYEEILGLERDSSAAARCMLQAPGGAGLALELVEDADKVEKFVIKMKKLQPKPPPVEARFKTPPRGIRRNTHNGSALPVRGIANGEWLY